MGKGRVLSVGQGGDVGSPQPRLDLRFLSNCPVTLGLSLPSCYSWCRHWMVGNCGAECIKRSKNADYETGLENK